MLDWQRESIVGKDRFPAESMNISVSVEQVHSGDTNEWVKAWMILNILH